MEWKLDYGKIDNYSKLAQFPLPLIIGVFD